MLDGIIVALVVGSAVAYLAWMFAPRRRTPAAACAACVRDPSRRLDLEPRIK